MAQATKKTSTGATVHMTTATAPATAPATATATVNPMLAMIAAMTATATEDEATAPATPMDPLAAARDAFASGMGETDLQQQGFANTYATLLNEFLPEGWYAIKPASDKSEDGKRVRREQKACYSALNARKHSNPSVAWARVCKAGLTLSVGAMSAEAEEKAAANKKSVYQKIQAALASIVTKLENCDADHKREIDMLAVIIKALPIK